MKLFSPLSITDTSIIFSQQRSSKMTDTKEELFPAIGSLADQTDKLTEAGPVNGETATAKSNEDEERPMQEIESLCMKCGEQVHSRPTTALFSQN